MWVDPRVGTSREGEVQAEFVAGIPIPSSSTSWASVSDDEEMATNGATGVIGEGG